MYSLTQPARPDTSPSLKLGWKWTSEWIRSPPPAEEKSVTVRLVWVEPIPQDPTIRSGRLELGKQKGTQSSETGSQGCTIFMKNFHFTTPSQFPKTIKYLNFYQMMHDTYEMNESHAHKTREQRRGPHPISIPNVPFGTLAQFFTRLCPLLSTQISIILTKL